MRTDLGEVGVIVADVNCALVRWELAHRVIPAAIELAVFDTLKRRNTLFIDSTHVSKLNSDVNRLFFEILPRLNPCVFVHIHDIFPGFEDPEQWLREGRAWNEQYLLRAFLQYNAHFQIRLFPGLLVNFDRAWFERNMPLVLSKSRRCSLDRKAGKLRSRSRAVKELFLKRVRHRRFASGGKPGERDDDAAMSISRRSPARGDIAFAPENIFALGSVFAPCRQRQDDSIPTKMAAIREDKPAS